MVKKIIKEGKKKFKLECSFKKKSQTKSFGESLSKGYEYRVKPVIIWGDKYWALYLRKK